MRLTKNFKKQRNRNQTGTMKANNTHMITQNNDFHEEYNNGNFITHKKNYKKKLQNIHIEMRK